MPEPGRTALEILTDDGSYGKTFLTDKITPIMTGSVGFFFAIYQNFGFRKPIFSGIQKHILYFATGAAIGYVVDQWRNDFLAERDAVLRHYVELHPDDFPREQRQKYKEVFQPWIPIR